MRQTLALNSGTISAAGQEAIANVLPFPLPLDWAWVAKVGGKGEYVGTFAKRVAKYAHKIGHKLASDTLGAIGSLVGEYTSKGTEYEFDIVSEFNWRAGDFGDSGSCFWGGRKAARGILEENGGQAIRFYKNGEGYGRAWIAPYGDGRIVFNAYGLDLSAIAMVYAAHLNTSYKKIRLTNNGDDSGTLWINSGAGFYIGAEGAVAYNTALDLNFETSESCCNCGAESEYEIFGEHYCADCAYEEYSHCEDCGEWVSNNDCHYVNDSCVCDDCLRSNYSYCDDCEEYHADDYCEKIDGRTVCKHCLENGDYDICSDCGHWHHIDNIVYVDDCAVCDSCLSCNYKQCARCDEWHNKDDVVDIDGDDVCEGCLENYVECSHCGALHECTEIDGGNYCSDCADELFEYADSIGCHVAIGQGVLV